MKKVMYFIQIGQQMSLMNCQKDKQNFKKKLKNKEQKINHLRNLKINFLNILMEILIQIIEQVIDLKQFMHMMLIIRPILLIERVLRLDKVLMQWIYQKSKKYLQDRVQNQSKLQILISRKQVDHQILKHPKKILTNMTYLTTVSWKC